MASEAGPGERNVPVEEAEEVLGGRGKIRPSCSPQVTGNIRAQIPRQLSREEKGPLAESSLSILLISCFDIYFLHSTKLLLFHYFI